MDNSAAELKELVEEIEKIEPACEIVAEETPETTDAETQPAEAETPSAETCASDTVVEPPYTTFKLKNTPTMFGDIKENNVIFCVDTSGSMHSALSAVQEHLIEALLQRAECKPDSLFNVIEFSSNVTQWSDKMVRCTPQTVAVAADWIKKLQCKSSTNTMDALMSAYSDHECEAVILITDGYSDQNPTEILDSVAYVSQNRPVHCFYIEQGNADTSALDFLRDLAMETYGSFHVISVSLHGLIERITPIYRAEMTAERIVRTTDGNIYPSNHKVCTVGTTLNTPVVLEPPPIVAYTHPFYPYHYFPYNYGAHYYNSPDVGWSHYRTVRSTLNNHAHAYDDYVPGAGAMLIGTDVLARRNADGFFYIGNVKNQILSNKFLVEIGPSKHGKFQDTVYQETYVHDIVSHTDALRHAVLTGDKVLAPWEPEGERYGPGVVISGQERRTATGGGPDEQLVVSFYNGKSASIPRDKAVWIPPQLHERITFELQLPKKVRCEFAEQDNLPYPEENQPGYPVSGPKAVPKHFPVHEAGWIHRNESVIVPHSGYITRNPYHVPAYPIYYKQQARPSEVTTEDVDKVVPGTDLTKDELNEKVMAQLMRYKMVLEGSQKTTEGSKLLKRRGKQEETTLIKTDKSVSFKDADSDLEPEIGDLETRDSGRGSQSDAELAAESDLELDDFDESELLEKSELNNDVATGTDRSLYYQRRLKRCHKPRWSYWGQDNAPTLLEPMHEGPYRVGPFEEPMTPIPWIMKTRQSYDGNREGLSSSMANYADYLAKAKPGDSVADALFMPKPPTTKPKKQAPGRSVSETLHGNMSEADRVALQRLDNRRQRAVKREEDWHQTYLDGERMKTLMVDQHREQTQAQIAREQQRAHDQLERSRLLREAKKEINGELRARIGESQAREAGRDDARIAALRRRRERMDDIRRQRSDEVEQVKQHRQDVRKSQSEAYWASRAAVSAEHESQQAVRDRAVRSAKCRRFEAFQRREEEAQRRKQDIAVCNDNKSAVFNSRIF